MNSYFGPDLDSNSDGFDHDPLGDIAALQQLLRDQYGRDSIVKEIIQNADDAGATELHLTWVAALQDVSGCKYMINGKAGIQSRIR